MADDDRLAGPEIRLPKLGTASIKPPTAEPSRARPRSEGNVGKVSTLHLQTREDLPDRPAVVHRMLSVNNS